jgi:hypothetical protein
MNSFADILVNMRVNARQGATEFNSALETMEAKARSTGGQLRSALGGSASDGLRNYAAQVPVLGNSLAGLSGPLLGVAAGVGAVGLALTKGLSELEQYQASIRGLNAVLRATGNNTGLSSAALVEYADQLESSFAIAQEEIIGAQKVLSSFDGVSGAVFKNAIVQAANLGAVYGGDLASNSEKLGRVLQNLAEGSVDGLSKSFKFLTPSTKEAIEALAKTGQTAKAQELLLQSLEQKIGGTASANGQGLNGATFRLKDAWGDMLRSMADGDLGKAVEATLNGIAGALSKLTAQVNAANQPQSIRFLNEDKESLQAARRKLAETRKAYGAGLVDRATLDSDIAYVQKRIDALRDSTNAVLKENYEAALKLPPAPLPSRSPPPAPSSKPDEDKAKPSKQSTEDKAAERAAARALELDRERTAEQQLRNKALEAELALAERSAQYAVQGLDVAERQRAALELQQRVGRELTALELERLTSANDLTGARRAQMAVIEAEIKAQRSLTEEEKKRLFAAVQITEARQAEIAATNDALDAARAAGEENQRRIEDSFNSLSDTWYDLFSGRVGNFWDRFKDDGLRALASVAAQFSLNPQGGLAGALTAGLGAFAGSNSGSALSQLLGGFSGLLGGGGGLSVSGFGGGQFQLGGAGFQASRFQTGFQGLAGGGGSGFFNITGNSAGGYPANGVPGYGGGVIVPGQRGDTGGLGGLGSTGGGLSKGFGAGSVGRLGVGVGGNLIGNLIGGTAGSAISGASTGFAIGGPIGGLIGGAIGLLGSVFGGSPRAGNTIKSGTTGTLAITHSFAKRGAEPTNALAQASIDTISKAAGLLGGSVSSNFYLGQIGTKKDKFVFQEQEGGSFGEQATSQKFATAQEAIAASLASILKRGGITGIDAKYNSIISQISRTGSNAEDAVSLIARDKEISAALLASTDSRSAQLKALDEQFAKDAALYDKFAYSAENARKLLDVQRKEIITGGQTPEDKLLAYNNPRAAALKALEKNFQAEVALYEKYGYDKAKLTELYLKERELTEKQYGRDFAGIETLIDQLTNGDLAGGTDRARFAQLQQKFSGLAGNPASGVDEVLRAAQELSALNIDLNASTAERFRLQQDITASLQGFLAQAKANDAASSKSSPAVEEKLIAVAETTAQSGELVAGQIGVTNEILEVIRSQLFGQTLYLSGAGGVGGGGRGFDFSGAQSF